MSYESINAQMEKLARDANKESLSPGLADYNVVSDTITGVNFRLKDNGFQALFVFCMVVLAAIGGAVFAALNPRWNLPWHGGALIGTFAGLVIGILTSGTFLMVYRAVRHFRGKHD